MRQIFSTFAAGVVVGPTTMTTVAVVDTPMRQYAISDYGIFLPNEMKNTHTHRRERARDAFMQFQSAFNMQTFQRYIIINTLKWTPKCSSSISVYKICCAFPFFFSCCFLFHCNNIFSMKLLHFSKFHFHRSITILTDDIRKFYSGGGAID